jgi:predicted tellurium resistance membrane protein TerC
MEFLGTPLTLESLNVLWQIIFIDVVLAGDNAIIVGMVASRVDPELRQRVILFGVGAAVVMRIGFSLVAVQLLAIPGLTFLVRMIVEGGHDLYQLAI